MRLAMIQMSNSGSVEKNMEKSLHAIAEAAEKGAELALFPESIRTESLQGADLILIPTVNTKAEPSEMFEWEVRVQAFQNSVAIAMCNRVGVEGEMDFAGESMAVDANGEILAQADDTEQIVYVDINLEKSGKVREKRPYTQLRRKEFYV